MISLAAYLALSLAAIRLGCWFGALCVVRYRRMVATHDRARLDEQIRRAQLARYCERARYPNLDMHLAVGENVPPQHREHARKRLRSWPSAC